MPMRLEPLFAIRSSSLGSYGQVRPNSLPYGECIPSTARSQVEQEIRHLTPCMSIIQLLRNLIALLERFYPQSESGRGRAIEYYFAQRIRKIWEALGLKIGRAYDGIKEHSVNSSFQN